MISVKVSGKETLKGKIEEQKMFDCVVYCASEVHICIIDNKLMHEKTERLASSLNIKYRNKISQ